MLSTVEPPEPEPEPDLLSPAAGLGDHCERAADDNGNSESMRAQRLEE